jgi:hypothetical protein
MPIDFPQPPRPVREVQEERPTAAAPAAPEGAAPLPAQPVFTVGLDELTAAGEAAAEESVSAAPTWRSTRLNSEGQPEVLELPEEGDAGAVAAGDDRFGPMIRDALAAADQDARVGEHDYEARLFRVPALSLLALWLHTSESLDLFVPVGPAPPGLEPNLVYDDGEFMSAARAAAERVSAAYRDAVDADELGS